MVERVFEDAQYLISKQLGRGMSRPSAAKHRKGFQPDCPPVASIIRTLAIFESRFEGTNYGAWGLIPAPVVLSERKNRPESNLRRFIRAALDQRLDGLALSKHTQAFGSLSPNTRRLLLVSQNLDERPDNAAITATEAESVNGTPSSCFKLVVQRSQ